MCKIIFLSIALFISSTTGSAQSKAKSTQKSVNNLLYPRLKYFYSASQIQALTQLIGKNQSLFKEMLQTVTEEEDTDGMNAKVITGAVPGLFTIMECIIMITPKNEVMAAVIKDEEVWFFTNSPKFVYELPATVENWRSGFADKLVKTFLSKALEEKINKETAGEFD